MPQRRAAREGKAKKGNLLTLTEVSQHTGISMPTLQRYKKLYQDQLPSTGEGRKQRYLKSALPVFERLKVENLGRRGRPRKTAAAATGRRAAKASRAGSGMLTLSEIRKRTGISYPTLVRYTKLHLRELPHVGQGRTRRFRPEAVDVFVRLRSESRRGPQPGAAAAARAEKGGRVVADARIVRLERTVSRLEKRLKKLLGKLSKPRKLI